MSDPLNIFEAPLGAINLIEASAGTGKTYAITGLYLRLLVERGYRAGDILVVTYTRAATEELKERIHKRLLESRQVFQQETGSDPFYREMLQRYPDRRQAIRRLNKAILAFDEAAIFTIHGFCQRVLSDAAFASGMPLTTAILADDSMVLQEIVEDFWRRRCHGIPPRWANHLIDAGIDPAKLRAGIQPHLNKPYLRIAALPDLEDFATLEPPFETAFRKVRHLWLAHREAVQDLLLNNTCLNRNTYNAGMVNWFTDLSAYFEEDEHPSPDYPDKFVNFTTSVLAKKVNKNKTAPQHPLFDACEELRLVADRLRGALDHYLLKLRQDLLLYCNQELPLRKRRLQVQSYDDLLLNLQSALADPRQGALLAENVRQRFAAALIDEFQDTDPTQYGIFQSIYQDSGQPVFLVGDPKQAIYSFRGADIFAYLRARQHAGKEHTLVTNWRSDPGLIQAVNTLFSHRPQPFLLEQIPFQQVEAAGKERPYLVAGDDAQAPLCFWFVNRREDDKPQNKTDINPRLAQAVAGRIATLLDLAQQDKAYIAESGRQQPLSGGDIAVLVRDHFQARLVRKALLELGVPSVQHSQDSVFESWEAQELEWVLRAVATPQQEALVRAALLTDLCGVSADALQRLMQQERDWENILFEFNDYHECWRDQGFIQMFRLLLTRRDGYRRLLSFRDGERRLTNVLHLGELLQAAGMKERLGMTGLLKWLAEQRQAEVLEDEARQLRLESDAELVKIVTIHKSKGLEYPIVFCPFLGQGKLRSASEETIVFHDPDNEFQAVLDLGSEHQDERRPQALREELAEDLRLTYVALTRAKYRCYVVWGAIRDAEQSALAWLLYRPPVSDPNKDPIEANRDYVTTVMKGEGLQAGLLKLAGESAGAIQVSPLPLEPVAPYRPDASQPELQARQFTGQVRAGRRFTSFTALYERRGVELPDYDAEPERVQEETDERSIFTFPRGARTGRCLHAIFEALDFTWDSQAITQTVAEQLQRFGFEQDWTDVISLTVEQVLHTPLDAGGQLRLARIGRARRLDEMDFIYPFERLEVERLKKLLRSYGEGRQELLESLDFRLLPGFMRGFIDLIFEHQGKFYLADYKSNWLGPTLEDYRPEKLNEAMTAGSYYLQYLIYTMALHRYLRWRLPDYDYERHFGGVRYLFLRGMRAEQGLRCGVFADRPARELIEKLDRYLSQAAT